MAVRSYDPDTDFGHVCTVILTLEIGHLVKVDNKCVKYYPDQLFREELCPGHGFSVYMHCDLDLVDMTLGRGHDTPFVHGQQLCEYYPDPPWQFGGIARTRILGTCVLWPWNEIGPCVIDKVMTHPWSMANKCVKYHFDPTLQRGVMTRTWRSVYVHCDLALWDMTLDQGHDTPLGNGQQLCEISSRSNLAVTSYGPEKDLGTWKWGVIA